MSSSLILVKTKKLYATPKKRECAILALKLENKKIIKINKN